jgi:hypothetical protein
MSPRCLARPAAYSAGSALLLTSLACAASQPAVPPVAEIPVAPLPKPKKLAPLPTPRSTTTTTTTTTTTVSAPSLAAVVAEPAQPAPGAPEAMPAPAAASPRIVLVDELPTRTTHPRAREVSEHGHHAKKHGRHGRPFHPAPGIIVDVTDAQGGNATAADLQRTARNDGYWPFRHCYEEGLRRNQDLSGSVSFSLYRQPSGIGSQLGQSSLHDESVTQCVLREAQHIDLPWGGEGEASADVKVSLATGDEPVPTAHPVPHADAIREGLRASWPAVQQCYASELGKHPDVGGRMELRFRVKADGEILEVSENEPRFGDVEVTKCVLGVYRTAKLPSLQGTHDATFVYALHFESAPGAPPATK